MTQHDPQPAPPSVTGDPKVHESSQSDSAVFFGWVFFPAKQETVFLGCFRPFFTPPGAGMHFRTG